MADLELIERYYLLAANGIKNEWFINANLSWYNYIDNLPERPKITYMIVVMNEQVFNGGFHQYFTNGYGQFAFQTIDALIKIGAFKKSDLLRRALAQVNFDNDEPEVFINRLINRDMELLFDKEDLFEPLSELNNEYDLYEDEDIVKLLSVFLNGTS